MVEHKCKIWIPSMSKMIPPIALSELVSERYGINSAVDTAEIMLLLCTDLKDVNGINICVGDILKSKNSKDLEVIKYGYFDDFELPLGSNYKEYGLYVESYRYRKKEVDGTYHLDTMICKYEVVGNIYENPDMLEGFK